MDPEESEKGVPALIDRIRKSWFAPAAALAAFSGFIAAGFRGRPAPKPPQPAPAPQPLVQLLQTRAPARTFERQYTRSLVLGAGTSSQPFRRSLAGIAVGPGDKIYVLGDDEIRCFEPGGGFVQGWRVAADASCLTAGSDGLIYVGTPGRIQVYAPTGSRTGGFDVGTPGQRAMITAVRTFGSEILVADGDARIIRRYDQGGRPLGVIGAKSKTGSFMLPNRWLDFDLDSRGVVRATDTGRHLVTAWAMDGSPLGSFGKFGMSDPADFVGCCNPVNLALMPDGNIVTAEKMIARIKVYSGEGKLLGLIGPEHFAQECTHIYLAVDSKGRILAADPVRREVGIFAPAVKTAERNREEVRPA